MSILSTIPSRRLTVLLAITRRSSQVRLVDNTPGGERRRGGRVLQTASKQNKNRRRRTWKKFLLKSDFSSFLIQSCSCSGCTSCRAGLCVGRNQGSGGRRGPGVRERPQRDASLTAAIRDTWPRGRSAPPICPIPGSRSSGSRRPRRSFVTGFTSFRERAGGRGALGARPRETQLRKGGSRAPQH